MNINTMEQHQKKDIMSGDVLSVQHGDGTTPTPADDSMKNTNALDAKQHTNVAAYTPQVINEVASNAERSVSNTYDTGHTVSANTNKQTTIPRTLKDSNILNQPLNNTTTSIRPVPHPVQLSGNAPTNSITSTPLREFILDTNSLGALLETIYNTTHSEEIKQVIACLVTLDIAITEQTRLNELHEAHTGKNLREQRHLNKDRKASLQETVKSVSNRLGQIEGQRMVHETKIKQGEMVANSHAFQIKGLHDRAQMLAEGGEWAEQELTEVKEGSEALQEKVEILELNNKGLNEQLQGVKKENQRVQEKVDTLEKEVKVLKDRDETREKRLAALEQLLSDKMECQ
jgi:hypothetical protein